jgi:hypothetical protein
LEVAIFLFVCNITDTVKQILINYFVLLPCNGAGIAQSVYWLDDIRCSGPGKIKNVLISMSRPASLSPVIRWTGYEADHSPVIISEIKSYTSAPPDTCMA